MIDMHAIVIDEPGGPEALTWREVADPVPEHGEVVLDVTATAVNRADLMQRRGKYPPPPGVSHYLGLECAGRIRALGDGVTGWRVGDEVCALLAGGGYAEQVAVPAEQLLPVPHGLSAAQAAALPEVACTVYSTVFMQAGLIAGEMFLVHGGASGIGTFAIQLAHARGATVACTASSADKRARCRELGADITIDYHDEDFVERLRAESDRRGANVILDIIGAKYLPRNVDALAPDGRLVIIGMQGGREGTLDIGKLLGKRGTVYAAGLRGRPVADKGRIVRGVRDEVWPLLADGTIRPVIDRTVPLADAAEAHRVVEATEHVGKVLLTP